MTLTAPRMTIAYTRSGGTDINRIDATGGVVVTKGDEMAKGNVAIYDLDRRLITMVGNVELRQRGNNLRGGRLVIALNSGRSEEHTSELQSLMRISYAVFCLKKKTKDTHKKTT